MGNRISRGVSRAQWLEAGLGTLVDAGVGDLTVNGLAKSLGIARSGFYWHFRDRDDFLQQMLEYWVHEFTEVISENPEIIALAPKARLVTIARTIQKYDLLRYEIALRHWALRDAKAARVVRRVDRKRFDFVGQAFSELGFSGDDLEARTMLFVCYQTWESIMFREIPAKRRTELIGQRIDVLTRG